MGKVSNFWYLHQYILIFFIITTCDITASSPSKFYTRGLKATWISWL